MFFSHPPLISRDNKCRTLLAGFSVHDDVESPEGSGCELNHLQLAGMLLSVDFLAVTFIFVASAFKSGCDGLAKFELCVRNLIYTI